MRMSGKNVFRLLLLAALAVLVAAPLVYGSGGSGGKHDRDDDARWALVDEHGKIVKQTGGFRIVDCYETNNNCYIDINENAKRQGLGATIANQNAVMGQAPSLTGEVGVGACASSVLACAPPGTEEKDVIVVTPRDSAGLETTPTTRKRFYVEVIGPNAKWH